MLSPLMGLVAFTNVMTISLYEGLPKCGFFFNANDRTSCLATINNHDR